MKGSITSKKFAAIFFLTLFVGLAPNFIFGDPPSPRLPASPKGFAGHGRRTGPGHHSFDSLFPKTWYTKATESCAQVWGAFDDLIAHPDALPTNRAIIIDAAIGRLVFAQFCLDLIANSQEQNVSPEDAAYLARVVDVVDERYKKLADSLEADRAYCMRRVIDALKKNVASL